MDLDTMLDDAAPRVAEPTPQLRSMLEQVVEASRPGRGRRGRKSIFRASAVLAGTAALGVAGAAAAAVLYTNANVPDSLVNKSFDWTSDEGHSCFVSVAFGPRPVTDPHYDPSQEQALDVVRDWASTFDAQSIDWPAAEDRWLAHTQAISATPTTRDALLGKFQGDELQQYAIESEVNRQIGVQLTAKGFDPRSLNAGVGAGCKR